MRGTAQGGGMMAGGAKMARPAKPGQTGATIVRPQWMVIAAATPSTPGSVNPSSAPAARAVASFSDNSYDDNATGKKFILKFPRRINLKNVALNLGLHSRALQYLFSTVTADTTWSVRARTRIRWITDAFDIEDRCWDNMVSSPDVTFSLSTLQQSLMAPFVRNLKKPAFADAEIQVSMDTDHVWYFNNASDRLAYGLIVDIRPEPDTINGAVSAVVATAAGTWNTDYTKPYLLLF